MKSYRELMRDRARELIEAALAEANGNICAAADILGLHRNTITRQISDLGINPREFHVRRQKRRKRVTIKTC